MERTSLIFERMVFEEKDKGTALVEIVTDLHIHVYGYLLNIGAAGGADAPHILSNEERARADRLVTEAHRSQFIAAHAGLRVILSRYCAGRPQDLIIKKAAKGKPFLPDYPSIRFNLTHSHGRALVAVANNREVGIDLEKVRPEVDVVKLARRILSDRDVAFIENGRPEQRHQRFLQTWVAREAVFKAAGTGMTFPLHCDDLELSHDGMDGQLILGDGKGEGAIKRVRFLPLERGWVGAVSAEGSNWRTAFCSIS